MEFDGWPPEAFTWFEQLAEHNSKAWFVDHRATYDSAVRGPLEALLAELEPEFGDASVSRPNRDTRFSRDKSPYKLEIYARTRRPDGGGVYVRLSAEGLFAGGGLYSPDRERLARLREAIADERTGPELERIVERLETDGMRLLRDGALKTAPRGYAADHPRIALLRLPHLAAGTELGRPVWVHTAEARDRIADLWRTFVPLMDWIATTA